MSISNPTGGGANASPPPALQVRDLSAGYGQGPVIAGVDLVVEPGEVVALLGANGAGKTTTLLALSGELDTAGSVELSGRTADEALHLRSRQGLMFVTEERSIFTGLTVRDNLRVGRVNSEETLRLFPELAVRMNVQAGQLSGGEQQMLTLARALCRKPRLLLADELSMGLAPMIVDRLLNAVRTATNETGMAALLVEQHVRKALNYADRAYVMRRGKIVMSGSADELKRDLSQIEREYLSTNSEQSTEARQQ